MDLNKVGIADIKSTLRPRRQIAIQDDYDLFKIILFYLYTGTVQFTNSAEICAEENDIPTTTDIVGLYAIAHRLTLDDLSAKAANFLKDTCTVQNITSRAFGRFAAKYEAVAKVYDGYLLGHWQDVIGSPEFEEFFRDAEDDQEEFIRINTKLRAMIRRECDTRM
jgi:hypothetical protein